ncbi:MAG: hypothetical protein ACJAS1_007069 [Oleiphilaceae bacterium]|jgi:hypothetical protein
MSYGFITDLHLAFVASKNCWQQEALRSVTKLSEIGVIKTVKYSSRIRKNRGQLGDTWYLDEVSIKINGVLHVLPLAGSRSRR